MARMTPERFAESPQTIPSQVFQAIGWTHALCCWSLDQGRDPRQIEGGEIIEQALRELRPAVGEIVPADTVRLALEIADEAAICGIESEFLGGGDDWFEYNPDCPHLVQRDIDYAERRGLIEWSKGRSMVRVKE